MNRGAKGEDKASHRMEEGGKVNQEIGEKEGKGSLWLRKGSKAIQMSAVGKDVERKDRRKREARRANPQPAEQAKVIQIERATKRAIKRH